MKKGAASKVDNGKTSRVSTSNTSSRVSTSSNASSRVSTSSNASSRVNTGSNASSRVNTGSNTSSRVNTGNNFYENKSANGTSTKTETSNNNTTKANTKNIGSKTTKAFEGATNPYGSKNYGQQAAHSTAKATSAGSRIISGIKDIKKARVAYIDNKKNPTKAKLKLKGKREARIHISKVKEKNKQDAIKDLSKVREKHLLKAEKMGLKTARDPKATVEKSEVKRNRRDRKFERKSAKAAYKNSSTFKAKQNIRQARLRIASKVIKVGGSVFSPNGSSNVGLQGASKTVSSVSKNISRVRRTLRRRAAKAPKKAEKARKKVQKKMEKYTRKKQKKNVYKTLKKENKEALKKMNYFNRMRAKHRLKNSVYGSRWDRLKNAIKKATEKMLKLLYMFLKEMLHIFIQFATFLFGSFLILLIPIIIIIFMIGGGTSIHTTSYPGKDNVMNEIEYNFKTKEDFLKTESADNPIIRYAKGQKGSSYDSYELHGKGNIKHEKHQLLAYLSMKWKKFEEGNDEEWGNLTNPAHVLIEMWQKDLIYKKYLRKLEYRVETRVKTNLVYEYTIREDGTYDMINPTFETKEQKILMIFIPDISIDEIAREDFDDEDFEHYEEMRDAKGDMTYDPQTYNEASEFINKANPEIDGTYEYEEGNAGSSGALKDYPENSAADGQCTDYVMRKAYTMYGYKFVTMGDGGHYSISFRDKGFPVSRTARVNNIVSFPPYLPAYGNYHALNQHGHTGWVEKVNSDGSIVISEWNFNGGLYKTNYRTLPKEYAAQLYYIDISR